MFEPNFTLTVKQNEAKKDLKFVNSLYPRVEQDTNNAKLAVPQRSTLSKDLSFYKCVICFCNSF